MEISMYMYIYIYREIDRRGTRKKSRLQVQDVQATYFLCLHRIKLDSIHEELGIEVFPAFTEDHKLSRHKDWRSCILFALLKE